MERMTVEERREVVAIILAEGSLVDTGAGASPQERASDWLRGVEAKALRLHNLYEGACSKDLGARGNALRETLTADLERSLRADFEKAGLGLYLNSDPRGNPVGILTPKTGRYNTMGGAECGWRL